MKKFSNKTIRRIVAIVWLIGLFSTIMGVILLIILINCSTGMNSLLTWSSMTGGMTEKLLEEFNSLKSTEENLLPFGILCWTISAVFIFSGDIWWECRNQLVSALKSFIIKDTNKYTKLSRNSNNDDTKGNMDIFFFD